jgi:glycosyltransferase involved in cell wall biosynthesis
VSCDVVIPCLDEAPAIPHVLALLPAGLRPIVVDNGSRDGTAEVAAALGATVVHEPRPGYGAAVHAGLLACTGEFTAVMDGDGSMDPRDLVRLLVDVAEDRADLAVGRRRHTPGSAAWHVRWGNRAIAWQVRRRLDVPVTDLAPMRVARRDALLRLGVRDRRFGYPLELLCRAGAARWRITEHDVGYHPRARGTRSKVSGSAAGTMRALRDFHRVWREVAR